MPVPRAKKKRKDKRVVMTAARVRATKTEALAQCFILVAAYMMDEMESPAEEILRLWDGVTRYAGAVDNRLITMGKVCKILSDYTGLDVRWNGTFSGKG